MFVDPYDQFYKACEQSNFDIVHGLIEQDISPKCKSVKWKGHSPLHFAAKHGDLNSVRTFIEMYRCNARCRDDSGCTPLHCACCSGHIDVVRYLVLECGCDPNVVDKKKASPLHYACDIGYYSVNFRYWQSNKMDELSASNVSVAKFLLEHNCDALKCDTLGRKPLVLHLACKFGPLEFVQSLIEEKGCDTNACDEKGDSLLHVACEADLQTLQHLVNGKYCDPTKYNQQGYNILHIACQKQDVETVHYLASQNLLAALNASSHDGQSKIDSPLLMASKNGSTEIIQCFIGSKGCNFNEEDLNGLTPLHYACNNGANFQLVEALIHAGANPAHCSPRHDSPISIACKSGSLELLKALTYKDVNCMDEYGNTPLHIACQYNQLELIKYLVHAMGSTTVQNRNGELPLHIANTLAAVKLVSNCDVHCKTISGDTPLHVACVKQILNIVEYLILKKHCDPSICNNRGEIPLHSMLQKIKRQCLCYFDENYQGDDYIDEVYQYNDIHSQDLMEIVLLVSNQCNHLLKTEAGETPLHIACQQWILKVVEYLAIQKGCHPSKHPDIYDNLHIHCACEEHNVHLLRVLATASNVNCQDMCGNTALHAACINENISAVKFLTEEMHCKQDIKNLRGEVPLHIACSHKSLEIIKLVSNIDVNIKTFERKVTPLHIACQMDHLEAVSYLIKTKHCDHNMTDEFGELPLHIACTKFLKMVKLVSDCDISHKCSSRSRGTALHIACSMMSLDIARYLVEEGKCNTNTENFNKELPLHIACKSKCLELVKLVSKNPDLNYDVVSAWTGTPLHIACYNGSLDIVQYLVRELHCNPGISNEKGELPLHIACKAQSVEIVKLVSQVPDPNTKVGFLHDTPLHLACRRSGKNDIVKYLVQELHCNPGISNKIGELPLHIACAQSLQMVQLVSSNCRMESRGRNRATPLHIACTHSLEIVKYLIECKHCDVSLQDDNGFTPLQCAHFSKSTEIVEYLITHAFFEDYSEDTPLHIACGYSYERTVRYLVRQGCDQSVQNIYGELPLHVACAQDSLKIVKLVSNCDINAPNADGDTPLHKASCYSIPTTVEFLTKICNINIQNTIGELPLHLACIKGSKEICKLLSGCKVNTQTVNGDTPLHYACKFASYDIVEFLIEGMKCNQNILNDRGELPLHIACRLQCLEKVKLVSICDINSLNEEGNTPLHIAMCFESDKFPHPMSSSGQTYFREHCNLPVIKYLVEHGSDPTIPNRGSMIPIHFACMMYDINLVKVLIIPSSVNCRNTCGDTPLHIACRYENTELVQFLLEQGADINLQNYYENLPLHIACKERLRYTGTIVSSNSCAYKIVQFLTQHKECNLSIQNKAGEIPLHTVFFKAMKLVSNPHIVNMLTTSGNTPLHLACNACESWKCIRNAKFLTQVLQCKQTIANHEGQLPIHIACQRNILELVQVVSSDHKVDFNSQTVDGNTPLHLACKSESYGIAVHLLLVCRCNPNILNDNGELPFHIACGSNNFKLVKLVGEHTKIITLKTNQGDTPLHIALRKGQQSIVKYLLQKENSNDFVSTKNILGELPIHVACLRKSIGVDFLKLIVCHMKDVNATIKQGSERGDNKSHPIMVAGDTPLHIACRRGNLSVVEYLVNHLKSSPSICNTNGELPLHIACSLNVASPVHSKESRMEIIRLVSNCDIAATTVTGDTVLHCACHIKAMDIVEHFKLVVSYEFAKCLPIRNNKKEAPLHIACSHGSFKLIQLTCNCDSINMQTECGDTPLHLVCRYRFPFDAQKTRIKIMKQIVKQNGCNLNITNDSNKLALHLACRYQTLDVVRLITDSSTFVDAQTTTGDTPLHEACRNEHPKASQIVEYLIKEKGCNPAIKNNALELPLHLACRRKSFQMITQLSSCNVDSITSTSNTCLLETFKNVTVTKSTPEVIKIAQYLVETKGCNPSILDDRGRTVLHYVCEANSQNLAIYFIQNCKMDVSLADSDGNTPIMLTSDMEIIKTLLEYNADPQPLYKMHHKFFEKHSLQSPPQTRVKLFVMGNAGVGKTALTESLQAEGKAIITQVNPELHTAGIIPNEFDSEIYGQVTIYDFAGQHEYYASHGTEMHSIMRSSPPVIILVVNLSEGKREVKRKILYWLSWIKNHCIAVGKPHLIILGSHADVLLSKQLCPKVELDGIMKMLDCKIHQFPLKFVASITMDCRDPLSPEIVTLQKFLKQSTCELQDTAVMSFTSHCLYVFLLDEFRHSRQAVTIDSIVNASIRISLVSSRTEQNISPSGLLPTDVTAILKICKQLDKRGHIMLITNSSHPHKSWVVLNKKMLMHEIIGILFAPLNFSEHIQLATSTGVVPFSRLQTALTQYDPHMVIELLKQLEFCNEIYDEEVLKLIYQEKTCSVDDRYFFFPSLVSIQSPSKVWVQSKMNRFGYQYGWILQCSAPDQFFTPEFLQLLLLRLAFHYALAPFVPPDSDHLTVVRACSVWKNGICWTNQDGIEVVVELPVKEQSKILAVMMRSVHGREYECIRLRASVLKKVTEICQDICPSVQTAEFFIDSKCLQFPIPTTTKMTLCGIPNILSAISNGKPYAVNDTGDMVYVEELLYFEPYIFFCSSILETFSSRSSERISDGFLHHMVEHLPSQKIELFRTVFQFSGSAHTLVQVFQKWRDRKDFEGTYECLQREFDQISIFGGRTKFNVLGVPCTIETSHPQEDSTVMTEHPIFGERPSMMDLQCLKWRNGDKEERLRLMDLLAPNWRDVGIALGLEVHLDSIEEECLRKPKRCIEKMFRKWLAESMNCSWNGLITALDDANIPCDLMRVLPVKIDR